MNQFLINSGYKMWKEEKDSFSNKWQYQKRLDNKQDFDQSVPLCFCNEKLLINIIEYRFDNPSVILLTEHSNSFEMYICHENFEGEWCDIKIYSLRDSEIKENLTKLEDKLISMWKVFAND